MSIESEGFKDSRYPDGCDDHNPNIVRNSNPLSMYGKPIKPHVVNAICFSYGLRLTKMSREDFQEAREAFIGIPLDTTITDENDWDTIDYFLIGPTLERHLKSM